MSRRSQYEVVLRLWQTTPCSSPIPHMSKRLNSIQRFIYIHSRHIIFPPTSFCRYCIFYFFRRHSGPSRPSTCQAPHGAPSVKTYRQYFNIMRQAIDSNPTSSAAHIFKIFKFALTALTDQLPVLLHFHPYPPTYHNGSQNSRSSINFAKVNLFYNFHQASKLCLLH